MILTVLSWQTPDGRVASTHVFRPGDLGSYMEAMVDLVLTVWSDVPGTRVRLVRMAFNVEGQAQPLAAARVQLQRDKDRRRAVFGQPSQHDCEVVVDQVV